MAIEANQDILEVLRLRWKYARRREMGFRAGELEVFTPINEIIKPDRVIPEVDISSHELRQIYLDNYLEEAKRNLMRRRFSNTIKGVFRMITNRYSRGKAK